MNTKNIKIRNGKDRCSYIIPGKWSGRLASWKDYCYDLKDSDIAKELTDDDFSLMDGDKMAGIAHVVESYGII